MPAEEKNRTQRTADAILRFIAEQGLQPGGRLPNESELSRRLEVGRGTVREAMKLLASRNIVTIRQGSGTYVAERPGMAEDPLGLQFIADKRQLSHDLIAIRFLIEPHIAAMAARSAEEAEIERLRGLAGEVEARILRGESHIAQDVELHTAIALCSRNLVVPRLIPIIHSTIQIFTDLKEPRLLRETIEIHRRVVDAIAAHNPVEAQDAMYLHLVHNRESLRAIERQQTTE